MRRRKILYVAFTAIACGGEALDVGETDPGTGGTDGAGGTGSTPRPGAPLPSWPAPDACASMSNLDIAGVWEGAFQDEQFRSQMPLRVEILGASELGGICGTLRWGEGPPLPPPTDPDQGWPDNARIGFGGATGYFHEGGTFTILDGGVRVTDVSEVRFRVAGQETWKPWCAIQPTYWLASSQNWSCIPGLVGWSSDDPNVDCTVHMENGSEIVVEHGKCGLCMSTEVCVCNETGCAANPVASSGLTAFFDLRFDADRATGTVEGGTLYRDILLNRVE